MRLHGDELLRQEQRRMRKAMQNGSGLDFQKRLAELEADKEKTVAMIKQVEAQTNQVIQAANEQGSHLNRALLRIEGAIAFIKAEVLGQTVTAPAGDQQHVHEHKPLIEVAKD